MTRTAQISTLLLSISILTALAGCTLNEGPIPDEEHGVSTAAPEVDPQELARPPEGDGRFDLDPEAAALPCRCVGTFKTTPFRSMHTGSCAQSLHWLPIVLSALIECDQELCSQTLVVTDPCYWEAPYWVVGGYMRYKCGTYVCESTPTPI